MNSYDKSILNVSYIEESTNLLGPYNRFVIWVHGCCFNCEGCLATNAKTGAYDEYDVNELAQRIVCCDCEGITISGGEPFLQADALLSLIREIKRFRDIGVIVYTGFTADELSQIDKASDLLSQIDILIDGRYVKELDDNRAYVGSSNQIIHYLSSRYAGIGKKYYSAKQRRAEIKFTGTQAVLIGVPSHGVLKTWQDIIDKSGGSNNDF